MCGGTVEHRKACIIQRQMLGDRRVYVKQYTLTGECDTVELLRARMSREVQVVRALASLRELPRCMGVMRIVAADLTNMRLTTEEIPGQLLLTTIRHGNWKVLRDSCTRALYLAGHWLRAFQSVPRDVATSPPSSRNATDFIEYCDDRMHILRNVGYPWPSDDARQKILAWLTKRIAEAPGEQLEAVWCHGDFGPHNIMWDREVMTPIDFATCSFSLPLLDVTRLITRLEMLSIQFPWRSWPLSLWRKACLRGYGAEKAEHWPLYAALMMIHLVAQLKKWVLEKPNSERQRWHGRWCRWRLRARLAKLVGSRALRSV